MGENLTPAAPLADVAGLLGAPMPSDMWSDEMEGRGLKGTSYTIGTIVGPPLFGLAGAATRLPRLLSRLPFLRKAPNAGDDLARVGRWMGDDELAKMLNSGMVQVGGGGTTHVAHPADIGTYFKQAAPGSKYVEFDVPKSSLFPSGWPGGAQIPGPNHVIARLAERRGSPVQTPVPACNILVVGSC